MHGTIVEIGASAYDESPIDLLEIIAMIARVGLRCRRILTLRCEAAGQPVTITFVRDEFLDKHTDEDV